MLESLIPERSAEDFVNGVIRIYLGTEEFLLAELTMNEMDAWAHKIDAELADLLRGVEKADETSDVLTRLAASRDRVIEVLATYPGAPEVEWMRVNAQPSQVIRSLMGVWSAANPLVATLVEVLMATSARSRLDGNVSALMSTLRHVSDGRYGTFESDSRGASSSPEWTPDSTKPERTTSTTSRPSGSATTSPDSPADTTRGGRSIVALPAVPPRQRRRRATSKQP